MPPPWILPLAVFFLGMGALLDGRPAKVLTVVGTVLAGVVLVLVLL